MSRKKAPGPPPAPVCVLGVTFEALVEAPDADLHALKTLVREALAEKGHRELKAQEAQRETKLMEAAPGTLVVWKNKRWKLEDTWWDHRRKSLATLYVTLRRPRTRTRAGVSYARAAEVTLLSEFAAKQLGVPVEDLE